MGLGFLGLKLLPLPEATAIRFATPIFIVVFAIFLLGECVRLFRLTAVAVGLVGVLIVMWSRLGAGGDGGDLALLIGYFVFGEVPTVPMLAGAALVIAAGVAIVWRERQIGKRTATEGKMRNLLKG